MFHQRTSCTQALTVGEYRQREQVYMSRIAAILHCADDAAFLERDQPNTVVKAFFLSGQRIASEAVYPGKRREGARVYRFRLQEIFCLSLSNKEKAVQVHGVRCPCTAREVIAAT